MPGVILIDQYKLEIPSYTKMYVGDAKTEKEFNSKKALESLGSKIKIIADVDSTHTGTIVNNRCYPADEAQRSLDTWLKPYPRPFLSAHPPRGLFTVDEEPTVLGRVQGAKFLALTDNLRDDWINPPERAKGSGYILNSVFFSGRDVVEQIADKRLLTVSMGMKADEMICPICLVDWVPSMLKDGCPPESCEHRPGQIYDVDARHFQGKMPMYHVTRQITYDHIAGTFRPAQPYSSILGFKVVDDSLRDAFAGDTLRGGIDGLALCDEAGHIVRFSEPDTGSYSPPPLTEHDALVLASMEDAKVLELIGEFSDGLDAADIRVAVDGVKTSGKYESWKRESGRGKRLGLRGAMPVMSDGFADASRRFLDRYTGADKDTLGLRLFASATPVVTASSQPVDGGNTMTLEEIKALSDKITNKMGDLEDGTVCNDAFFKERLEAELFEKVSFASLTDEQVAAIRTEDRELEIDGIAEGVIDKVLTAAARKRLPDSAFCGPARSFPAHDESHIRYGMQSIDKAKSLTDEQKARTRACLMSLAKKAGIEVAGEKSKTDSTADKALEEKIVLLERDLADTQGNNTRLASELKAASLERDDIFDKLQASLVNQLFDLRVKLEKVDVKSLDDAGKTAYLEKLGRRSLESLEDSLMDLRAENAVDAAPAAPVEDPNTIQDGQTGDLDTDTDKDAAPAGDGDDGTGGPSLNNLEKIKRGFTA